MATESLKKVPSLGSDKVTLSKKKLSEVTQLKKVALEYFEFATKDNLDSGSLSQSLQQAKSSILLALTSLPNDADALNLYGRIELELGNTENSRQAILLALEEQPKNGGYWYSLGQVDLAEQNFTDAERCFRKAITYAPKNTKAEQLLAYTIEAQGNTVEAFRLYRELAKTKPNDLHVKAKLFECSKNLVSDYYDPELEHDLLTYLSWDNTNPNHLSSLICSLIEHKLDISPSSCHATIQEISVDILFLSAISKLTIKSPSIEKLIMAIRHEILMISTNTGRIKNSLVPLAVSISEYSFNNEFLLPSTEAELSMQTALINLCDSGLMLSNKKPIDFSGALLLLSMYCPWSALNTYEDIVSLSLENYPDHLKPLLNKNLELHQLSKITVPPITNISTGTSSKVRDQYERYPYPRWDNLDYKKSTHYITALIHEYPDFIPPTFLSSNNLDVLIAGCGTGRHALHVAKYFHGTKVTAIDLSLASLTYAKSKADKLGLDNIEFRQADLINLSSDQSEYHIIECSGVLHHIKEHQIALTNLLNNLVPLGLIKIALYSERARTSVIKIREAFNRESIIRDPRKIKLIRHAIFDSDCITGKEQLIKSDDFYSLSGTVDLLFHEFEEQYTPLKIKHLCEKNELEFLGFCSLEKQTSDNFIKFNGLDSDLTDLNLWEEYEKHNPDTFSRMYQFYCQKKN